MIVRVVENWQGQSVDVYVFERDAMREGARPGHMYRPDPEDGNRLKLVDVDFDKLEGELSTGRYFSAPPPTYRIPTDVLEEIMSAYLKDHPSANRDDAVKDARAVRDRLLTLVEGVVQAPQYNPPTSGPRL